MRPKSKCEIDIRSLSHLFSIAEHEFLLINYNIPDVLSYFLLGYLIPFNMGRCRIRFSWNARMQYVRDLEASATTNNAFLSSG